MNNYSELLKDPRWQKKRLEILERDNWECQSCGDSENTLHVHHMCYVKSKKPWEYEDGTLITLCQTCHQEETDFAFQASCDLSKVIRKNFFSYRIQELIKGFENMSCNSFYPPTADIIAFMLKDKDCLIYAGEKYFENLRKKREVNDDK